MKQIPSLFFFLCFAGQLSSYGQEVNTDTISSAMININEYGVVVMRQFLFVHPKDSTLMQRNRCGQMMPLTECMYVFSADRRRRPKKPHRFWISQDNQGFLYLMPFWGNPIKLFPNGQRYRQLGQPTKR